MDTIRTESQTILEEINSAFDEAKFFFYDGPEYIFVNIAKNDVQHCKLIIEKDNFYVAVSGETSDEVIFSKNQDTITESATIRNLLKVHNKHIDSIILGFIPNDDRAYILSKSIIKQLPTSIVASFYEDFGSKFNEVLILDKYTSETFGPVYDALIDPKKLSLLKQKDFDLMDLHGLIDANVYSFYKRKHSELLNEMILLSDFLHKPMKIRLMSSVQEYTLQKQMFAGNPCIIPFQILCNDEGRQINIFNGLPISMKFSNEEKNNHQWKFSISDTSATDININSYRDQTVRQWLSLFPSNVVRLSDDYNESNESDVAIEDAPAENKNSISWTPIKDIYGRLIADTDNDEMSFIAYLRDFSGNAIREHDRLDMDIFRNTYLNEPIINDGHYRSYDMSCFRSHPYDSDKNILKLSKLGKIDLMIDIIDKNIDFNADDFDDINTPCVSSIERGNIYAGFININIDEY